MRTWTLVLLLVAAYGLAEETATNFKNATAGGRYYGEHDNHRYKNRHHDIIDQFVCDLDATILVVASSHRKEYGEHYGNNEHHNYGGDRKYDGGEKQYGGERKYGGEQQYGGGNRYARDVSYDRSGGSYQQQRGHGGEGYGNSNDHSYGSGGSYGEKREHSYSPRAVPNAVRLKCSHIATRSEHDCHSCCHLAARRDHSVSKRDIFGFIVDADELVDGDYGVARRKRSTNEYAGSQAGPPAPPPNGYPAPSSGGYPAPSQQQEYGGQSSSGYNGPSAEQPSSSQGYNGQSNYGSESGGYQGSQGGHESAPAPEYTPSEFKESKGYSNDNDNDDNYYRYRGPPKHGRCVCCAPKRYEHEYERHHHERSYRRDHHERNYGRDSY